MNQERNYLLALRAMVAEARISRAYSAMEGTHRFISPQAGELSSIEVASATLGRDYNGEYGMIYQEAAEDTSRDKGARI